MSDSQVVAKLQKKKIHLIDDPLHQVKLSLQRGVEKKSQRVEFDPHAVIDALRSNLPQVCPLALRKADASFNGDPPPHQADVELPDSSVITVSSKDKSYPPP